MQNSSSSLDSAAYIPKLANNKPYDTTTTSAATTTTTAAAASSSSISLSQQGNRNRRPSSFTQNSKRGSETFSPSGLTLQLDRASPAIDDESESSPLARPIALGEDFYWKSRRPSSISNYSTNSSVGKGRRPSSSSTTQYSGASSPATAATIRTSSRSKILASSNAFIDSTSTPLPYEYRVRSGSGDRGILPPPDTPNRQTSNSPKSGSSKLPSSISTRSRSNSNLSVITTGNASLSDQKRRKPSTSVDSAKEGITMQSRNDFEATNNLTHRSDQILVSPSTSSLPQTVKTKPRQSSIPTSPATSPQLQEGEELKKKADDPKPSLRSRLFGLRRSSKESSEEPSDQEPTSVPSISAPIDVPGVTIGRTPLMKEKPVVKPLYTRGDELLSPQSATLQGAVAKTISLEDGIDEKSDRAPSMRLQDSKDTNNSWITSMSNVSPPFVPDFDRLQASPISLSRTNSGEDSAVSPQPLLRTFSWPQGERKGSFVSVKGNAGVGTGYRFENAANMPSRKNSPEQSRKNSPNIDLSGPPSFLSIDPRPSIDSPPAERSEKSRSTVKLGSPAPFDAESTDSTRRMRGHFRSDSSNSIQSFQARSPTKSYTPSGARQSDSIRKSRHQSTSSLSLAIGDASAENVAGEVAGRNQKQRSGTLESVNSGGGGGPPSPIAHAPRTSSLNGRPPGVLSRTSSASTSFRTATSPVEHRAEFIRPEDQLRGSAGTRESYRPRSGHGVEENPYIEKQTRNRSPSHVVRRLERVSQEMSQSEHSHAHTAEGEQEFKSSKPERRSVMISSGEEPKRPTKSPLRKISANLVQQQMAAERLPSRPISQAGPSVNSLVSSNGQLNTQKERAEQSIGRSPPRQSLEDVVLLNAIAAQAVNVGEGNVTPSSLANVKKMNEISTNEARQPLIPESAKRLGALTRDSRDLIGSSASANVSTTSLTTEEEHGSNHLPTTPKMLSSKYKSFKAKTPALANAFGKRNEGSRSASANDMLEVDDNSDMASISASLLSKRKVKKWPFTSKDSTGEAATELERRFPGSKISNTLRGRKSELQTARPLIRRVYDSPRIDDGEKSDSGGEEEHSRIPSEGSTVMQIPTSINQSRESLARFPSSSTPNTPILPSEELSPELKRIVHRRNVIRELVETEKSYSSDLAVVRDIYLARARLAVGLSPNAQLQTPLSSHTIPSTTSPGTPSSAFSAVSHSSTSKPSPLYAAHRNIQRMTSSDLRLPPSSPIVPSHSTASPSSFASSEPSNRSSTYTVSSQTSQASDSSFPFQVSNPPPLPATPPNLSGLTNATSGTTIHAMSPSSNSSTSTFSTARNSMGKPKMQVNTTSLSNLSTNSNNNTTPLIDVGLTISDVRVMFAHLETCSAFAEDMASVLAGSMGTFARSKRINMMDIGPEVDKEDDNIGEIFLHLMPRIRKTYIDYCSRHEASMLRLQEVVAASPKAQNFFKECTEVARKHTNAWDLASLLIKPIQRVLKYPLLIQQILNSTGKTHPDYNRLALALDEIQAVADEINQVKKRRDLADSLITGRVKEIRSVLATTTSTKGKKRSEIYSEDGLLTPFGAEEASLEEYSTMIKQYQSLLEHVTRYGPDCLAWSISLRESYEAQLRLIKGLQRTYQLQIEVEGPDGITLTKESKEAIKDEDRLLSFYIQLLQKVINENCRRLHQEIQQSILPNVVQIVDMFEPPNLVIAKRDERLGEYQRYRQALLAGRQSERKVLDNANGFIALNAQLVEDLPIFIHSIQVLLDLSIWNFSQLQANHFDQLRNRILTFWHKVAKRKEEIIPHPTSPGLFTMRQILPVRAFWDRHSVSAAWIDSLGIVQREGEREILLDDSDSSSSASSTAGAGTGKFSTSLQVPRYEKRNASSTSAPLLVRTNSSQSGVSTTYLQAATNPRRPSGVANLMRTLSGTFSKENGNGDVPPLPSDAILKHTPASTPPVNNRISVPPTLPNLHFRNDEDGQDGYFVQSGPVSFLDNKENQVRKEPYDSPGNFSHSFVNINEPPLQMTRSASNMSSISVPTKIGGNNNSNNNRESTPTHHKMNILYQCTAIVDSSFETQAIKLHMGWPLLDLVKGDTFKALSSDDRADPPLLFGRIDRTGDLGWVQKRCF